MKKVKILQPIASMDWSYRPGEIVDLETAVADGWAAAGIAEIVEESKPEPKSRK